MTQISFPKSPVVGDCVEITSSSTEKLPINIVGHTDAGKPLKIIYPWGVESGASDGTTTISTITTANITFLFKCISTKTEHVWILGHAGVYPHFAEKIAAIEARLTELEASIGNL